MEVVCGNCKSRFKVSDEKLLTGKAVSMKCSKCQTRIELQGSAPGRTNRAKEDRHHGVSERTASAYDPSERPFDYLQEGIETALVCEHDLAIKQKICSLLQRMDYHVVEAASARNALKYLRFHLYNIIVVNENFEASSADANHVLQYLNQLPISVRRNMFVILLGKNFRTTDNMLAFNKSVNLVVNLKDVDDMEKILKSALKDHMAFYQVFMESLKKAGRA